MVIKVNIKQLGKGNPKVSGVEFQLREQPETVRGLIRECVRTCIARYAEATARGDSPRPLTPEEMADMEAVGRIAFGIHYGPGLPDEEKAVSDAFQAYEDGLFRIFVGDTETGALDAPMALDNDAEVTFLRLVMLAGRMW